jgi:hypothetical protein
MLSVVVEATTSFKPALRTLEQNAARFGDVQIVGGHAAREAGDRWRAQAEDPQHDALVLLPPDVDAGPMALATLCAQMDEYGGPRRDCCTHGGYTQFAVDTTLVLAPGTNVVACAFMALLALLDTVRWAVNAGHYHRSCDLRAVAVQRAWGAKQPRRWLARPSRFWWWVRTGVCPALLDGDALECWQRPPETGLDLVMRQLRTRPELGPGLWWLGALLAWALTCGAWWLAPWAWAYLQLALLLALAAAARFRIIWPATWLYAAAVALALPCAVVAPAVLLWARLTSANKGTFTWPGVPGPLRRSASGRRLPECVRTGRLGRRCECRRGAQRQ